MNNTALILFRALPEFKACAPWIQELAEAAFIRGMEEGKRQCGPGMPPTRYTLDSFSHGNQEVRQMTTDNQRGTWVKWEDVASLFATGERS